MSRVTYVSGRIHKIRCIARVTDPEAFLKAVVFMDVGDWELVKQMLGQKQSGVPPPVLEMKLEVR